MKQFYLAGILLTLFQMPYLGSGQLLAEQVQPEERKIAGLLLFYASRKDDRGFHLIMGDKRWRVDMTEGLQETLDVLADKSKVYRFEGFGITNEQGKHLIHGRKVTLTALKRLKPSSIKTLSLLADYFGVDPKEHQISQGNRASERGSSYYSKTLVDEDNFWSPWQSLGGGASVSYGKWYWTWSDGSKHTSPEPTKRNAYGDEVGTKYWDSNGRPTNAATYYRQFREYHTPSRRSYRRR